MRKVELYENLLTLTLILLSFHHLQCFITFDVSKFININFVVACGVCLFVCLFFFLFGLIFKTLELYDMEIMKHLFDL